MDDLVASTLKVFDAADASAAASTGSVDSGVSFLQEVNDKVVKTTMLKMIFFIVLCLKFEQK
jgi:hypothetical protein